MTNNTALGHLAVLTGIGDRIRHTADELAILTTDRHWAITRAREVGIPWDDIAHALGMTNGHAARMSHTRGGDG